MNLFSLLLRNLGYFWRGNLAVLLGVLVGCTVLTGALFVGDSLQGSLREQTLKRLGWVDHALAAPRFFRSALAKEVATGAEARVSPALMLQASCSTGEKVARRQVRGVTVLGVESGFFDGSPPERFGEKAEGDVPLAWLSPAMAEALDVKAGDRITLQLQKIEDVPREAGLGKKDVLLEEWDLIAAAVLDDAQMGARFNLRPELQAPRNVVVALPHLQARLKLSGQANALLAAGDGKKLASALRDKLTLEDWGLELHTPATRAKAIVSRYDTDRDGELDGFEWRSSRRLKGIFMPKYAWAIDEGLSTEKRKLRVRKLADLTDSIARSFPYLALESKQLLLSKQVAEAGMEMAEETKLIAAPTLVYLCRMDAGKRRFAGVVAALDPAKAWPLGPFLPPGVSSLDDNQIVLLDDSAEDDAKPAKGSSIVLRFKPPESHGPAADVVRTFTLAGLLPPKGPAVDPFLTPDFPGITDKDDIGAWDLPFDDPDWRKNISTEYDDAYWKRFKATPKAYVTLQRGQALWGSPRFGELTSLRLALPGYKPDAPPTLDQLEQAATRYRKALLERLKPDAGGFVFDDVRATGLDASQGGTPFGMLFLCFSFFLILSSLLLVGLLYRLNLDRRARQVGVLAAEGYPRSTIRQLLLTEGMILALVGVLLGCLAALLYSRLLVDLLAYLWPGGALRSLLRPHATISSAGWGALGTMAAAAVTIWWVVRVLGKVAPRALLAGQTTEENDPGPARRSWWLPVITLVAALVGAALLVLGFFVPGQEAQAGTFFGSGMMFLTAGLCLVRLWMRLDRSGQIAGRGPGAVARLGIRNAARHPARSLLAIGLLASAAFLIVAVESFRRTAKEGTGEKTSADGGFALLAETDLPVIRDLNTPEGRRELLQRLRTRLVNDLGMKSDEADKEIATAEDLLKRSTVIAFRARAGDDASCLNLYKPRSPRVLGVPRALIERGGFVFDSTLKPDAEEKANPWLILQRSEGIPAFGEANTVMWMLKSSQGGKVEVANGGEKRELTISGLLHDSVFQSSLLISEEHFLRLYPSTEGYNYFLIASPKDEQAAVKRLFQQALADRGVEVTTTRERLEAFLAVENTYLSTFQALGGLGLLLGSLGLVVVLLRAVWERRSELALLRALGYPRATLGWLVLSENAFLLLVGLVVGSTAALLSILPQLVRGVGSVPWLNLALLFAGVLLLALTTAALATAAVVRAALVPALRRE